MQCFVLNNGPSAVCPDGGQECEFTGAFFVDDTLHACVNECPKKCLHIVIELYSVAFDIFASHDFVLDSEHGKSVLVLQFSGTLAESILGLVRELDNLSDVPSRALGSTSVHIYCD